MTNRISPIIVSAVGLLFLLLLLLANPKPVNACSPDFNWRNYWYRQSYEFDPADLPPGVTMTVSYDVYPAAGELIFSTSLPDKTTYVTPNLYSNPTLYNLKQTQVVEEKFIDENNLHYYNVRGQYGLTFHPIELFPIDRKGLNGEAPELKPDSPPKEKSYFIVLIHDLEVYRVPISVSFTPSPSYNPEFFSRDSSPEQLYELADVILTGAALSTNNIQQQGTLYGDAEITVGSWLKGTGPEKIMVGPYGDGADCADTIAYDSPYIFYLKKVGDSYRGIASNNTYPITKGTYNQAKIEDIKAFVGQEPIEFESEQLFQKAGAGTIIQEEIVKEPDSPDNRLMFVFAA
ncbi:MAG: hypothetical protein AAGD96_19885, partial [Chloroflexota bacterium]